MNDFNQFNRDSNNANDDSNDNNIGGRTGPPTLPGGRASGSDPHITCFNISHKSRTNKCYIYIYIYIKRERERERKRER